MESDKRKAGLEQWWAIGIGLFASFQLVVGPLEVAFPRINFMQTLLVLAFLVVSVWRLRRGLPSQFAKWALIILAVGLLLLGLQLVTLPTALWSSLPGRQVILDTLIAARIKPGPMPLSTDPYLTQSVILHIMPSVGLFFASLSVAPQHRRTVAIVIVAAAVACAVLGLAQRYQGLNSSLYLFPNEDSSAKGTFLNRNFFAAQLYCSVPLVAALGVATVMGRGMKRFVIALMLLAYFVALMAALGASGSRGGVGLAMLAVILSSGLVWSGRARDSAGSNAARFVLPVVVIGIVLVAQFGLVALLRIAETDSTSDLRLTMASTTMEAIKAYFPVGSGFGSFVPVYKLFENPDLIGNQFINNAHNDWLQLALEGGLPMICILVAFVFWYLAATFKVWWKGSNSIEDLLLRAASLVILLLLLHSVIDYPLRTRHLMALFAICCGFLAFGVHFKSLASKPPSGDRGKRPLPVFKPERQKPYFHRHDAEAAK